MTWASASTYAGTYVAPSASSILVTLSRSAIASKSRTDIGVPRSEGRDVAGPGRAIGPVVGRLVIGSAVAPRRPSRPHPQAKNVATRATGRTGRKLSRRWGFIALLFPQPQGVRPHNPRV